MEILKAVLFGIALIITMWNIKGILYIIINKENEDNFNVTLQIVSCLLWSILYYIS